MNKYNALLAFCLNLICFFKFLLDDSECFEIF